MFYFTGSGKLRKSFILGLVGYHLCFEMIALATMQKMNLWGANGSRADYSSSVERR